MCWRIPLQRVLNQGLIVMVISCSGHKFPLSLCILPLSNPSSSTLSSSSDPCADNRAIWHAIWGRLLSLPVPLSPRLPHSPSARQADYHRTQYCPLQPQLLQKWQSVPEHPGVRFISLGHILFIYSPLFDQIKPNEISILLETLPLITFHLTNIFFWIVVERGQVPHGVLPRAFHLSSSPSSPWWQRTHTIMNRALSRYGCGLQPWIAHTQSQPFCKCRHFSPPRCFFCHVHKRTVTQNTVQTK